MEKVVMQAVKIFWASRMLSLRDFLSTLRRWSLHRAGKSIGFNSLLSGGGVTVGGARFGCRCMNGVGG
ncbi:hypothetical protein BC938DRAFT_472728, partial [Jimgerdemannia flammicorona]